MDLVSNRVLIFGVDSFTGFHLSTHLKKLNYEVIGTTLSDCDLRDKNSVKKVLKDKKANYIINLSAISFVAHENIKEIYDVNFFGALNILDSLIELNFNPKKIIFPSSATVYGNIEVNEIDEDICPNPINHYGNSKLAMENMVKTYFDKLNIIMLRSFNYTGIKQRDNFLIPKIIKHYKEKKSEIELGNLNVIREFNDVRFVIDIYAKLLEIKESSLILNLCTSNGIKLLDVIETMNEIANYEIKVKINPQFVRENEIIKIVGSTKKLFSFVKPEKIYTIEETLKKMFF